MAPGAGHNVHVANVAMPIVKVDNGRTRIGSSAVCGRKGRDLHRVQKLSSTKPVLPQRWCSTAGSAWR
jgi:hypothetical protein